MSQSNDEDKVMTAAELLRRKKRTGASTTKEEVARKPKETGADIDDEIARLEAELAQDDSDSEGSSSSEDESVSDSSRVKSKPMETTISNGVVSLSSVKDELIEGLPDELLPKVPPKRKSKKNEDMKAKRRKGDAQPSSGLEIAVKEVLSGYVARSSEKLPFYCRVCQKQYTNETDFFVHRETDFHKAAVEAERRASYCKLCHKQLTSPAQMKEHLKSKPHRDRLRLVASKQQHQQHHHRGDNRNSSRKGGKGRDGRSSRQWV